VALVAEYQNLNSAGVSDDVDEEKSGQIGHYQLQSCASIRC
jgi:hypothetical protein